MAWESCGGSSDSGSARSGSSRWCKQVQVAAAAWRCRQTHRQAEEQTDRGTGTQWSCHAPCALLGGVCSPAAAAAAAQSSYFESDPHSGSDRAAVRNHDWRWRILLSWRDMPDSEMEKRCLAFDYIWWRIWLHEAQLLKNKQLCLYFCFPPQWKTRWLVLRKPSPVAGKHTPRLVLVVFTHVTQYWFVSTNVWNFCAAR